MINNFCAPVCSSYSSPVVWSSSIKDDFSAFLLIKSIYDKILVSFFILLIYL